MCPKWFVVMFLPLLFHCFYWGQGHFPWISPWSRQHSFEFSLISRLGFVNEDLVEIVTREETESFGSAWFRHMELCIIIVQEQLLNSMQRGAILLYDSGIFIFLFFFWGLIVILLFDYDEQDKVAKFVKDYGTWCPPVILVRYIRIEAVEEMRKKRKPSCRRPRKITFQLVKMGWNETVLLSNIWAKKNCGKMYRKDLVLVFEFANSNVLALPCKCIEKSWFSHRKREKMRE